MMVTEGTKSTLDELRGRMPELRKKEVSLRTQLDVLDAEIIDRESCLALADDLTSFLARLHEAAQGSSISDRQRVLRLLVKEVLVGRDRILVRHSIPSSRRDPPSGLLLRGRSHRTALWRALCRARQRTAAEDSGGQDVPEEPQHLPVAQAFPKTLQDAVVPEPVEAGDQLEESRTGPGTSPGAPGSTRQ